MPHGTINVLGNIPGQFHTWNSVNNGVTWVDVGYTANGSWRNVRYYRPPSTSNPRRGDNTRRPNNWTAIGGQCTVSGETFAVIKAAGSFQQRRTGKYNPYWCKPNVLGNVPVISSTLKADTAQKALAQYTARSVQLNTAMRETRDTLKMVGNAATDLAHGIDRVLAKEKPIPARAWKQLPARYLEYLYGWRPVSEDVANAFTELAELQNKGYARKLTLSASRTLRSQQRVVNNGFGSTMMCVDYASLTQVEKCGFTFKLPDWFDEALPVVSPFGNLWEQTPYSFVVDWFLPIGNWVGALESMQLSPFFQEGWQSSKLTRVFTGSEFSQADNAFPFLSQGPIRVTGSDYLYTRSVVNSLGSVMTFPSLRSPMSLDHAAQGLSLLSQVFRKYGFT